MDTLAFQLNSQFSLLQNIEFCCRILAAAIVGGIIGFERSHRFKEAGFRTHVIVCSTTAILMILSKYGFADLKGVGDTFFAGSRGADSARIAAQAVSGISFLCAGVIFKTGSNVRGLTTAAGLWLTANLGLVFGAGLYVIGGFALLLLFVLQFFITHVFNGADGYSGNDLHFKTTGDDGFHDELLEQLKKWNAKVVESNITHNTDGSIDYDLIVRRRTEITYDELKKFIASREDVVAFKTSPLINHFR
ncbi:MAG: MgtC/SapB family protein [Lachnospiraceae bacterium]|nr:MgtC/SapB family protein [Lachnospiraceae bacterium]